MPEIRADQDVVTQITVAEAEEGKQDELLALMTGRPKFMSRQPGFVSSSLDGKATSVVAAPDRDSSNLDLHIAR
jgi:hypothetical protein